MKAFLSRILLQKKFHHNKIFSRLIRPEAQFYLIWTSTFGLNEIQWSGTWGWTTGIKSYFILLSTIYCFSHILFYFFIGVLKLYLRRFIRLYSYKHRIQFVQISFPTFSFQTVSYYLFFCTPGPKQIYEKRNVSFKFRKWSFLQKVCLKNQKTRQQDREVQDLLVNMD